MPEISAADLALAFGHVLLEERCAFRATRASAGASDPTRAALDGTGTGAGSGRLVSAGRDGQASVERAPVNRAALPALVDARAVAVDTGLQLTAAILLRAESARYGVRSWRCNRARHGTPPPRFPLVVVVISSSSLS